MTGRYNGVFYPLPLDLQYYTLFRKSKLKLYWSIIKPIVIYAYETWVLKETIKNRLMIFERKVLRRIFVPTKERDGTWRIKTNDELDELIRHKNRINHIKPQRFLAIYIECRKREWHKSI
jgi:hypothetical protein